MNIIKKIYQNSLIKSTMLLCIVFSISYNINAQCPPVSSLSVINSSSYGVSDGQAVIQVNAGIGPFTYYWENLSTATPASGPTTSTINIDTLSNALSGTYTVSVIDAGCPSTFLIDTVIILGSGGTFSYNGSLALCGNTTSLLTAHVSGCSSSSTVLGTQFTLSDGFTTLLDSIVLSDSIQLPVLGAGTYYITALNQDNGCISSDTFSITTNSLSANIFSTNILNSSNLGTVSITANGGIAPYFLCWQDPSLPPPCATQASWSNGDTITNLSTGTYTYTIVSSDGCNVTGSVTIQEACSSQLTNNYTICDDEIYLDASVNMITPGSYSFEYILTDLNGVIIDNVNSSNNTISFNNPVVSSGDYFLTVNELNTGCVSTDSINIVSNPITINSTVNSITNPALCNGSVFVTPNTGAFPFTFNWDTNGVVFSSNVGVNSSITGLCADTYCLDIVDGNGCTLQNCYDVLFVPCDVNLSVLDSIDCYEGIGVIEVSVDSLGLPIGPDPFTGNRYVYSLFTTNPLTPYGAPQSSNSSTFIFPNLPSDNYLVTVYDSSYSSFCASDSLFLSQPDPITIYATADSTSAPWIEDGVITIDSITGGTSPFSITWLDSTGTILSTSGVLQQDSLGYSNEYNGGYTINVTDTNGCIGSAIIYIHPQNSGDSLYIDSAYSVNPTCFGDCDGFLWAKMKNVGTYSVQPFTFYWVDEIGDTLAVDSLGSPWYNPSHIASFNGAGNLACAGIYTLHFYDYYGNYGGIYNFNLTQPDSMSVGIGEGSGSFGVSDIVILDCGRDIVLSSLTTGGNITNDTTLISTNTLQFTNFANGFADTLTPGGDYLLVVTGIYQDAFGNSFDAAYEYDTLPAIPVMDWVWDGNTTHRPDPDNYQSNHTYTFPFTANTTGIHQFAILNPGNLYTGNLTFQIFELSLGVSLYSYEWTTDPASVPAVVSTADTVLANPGITPTDYILTVTDNLGCQAADTIEVMWDLYALNFDYVSVNNVLCNSDTTGYIAMNADTNSGFPPYTYILNGNPSNDTTILLPSGQYTISIVDDIGCLSQDSIVTILQSDSLYACGMDTSQVPVLLESFTMTFDTAYSYTTNISTQFGLNYMLVVDGTYRDTWGNPYKDAAFQYNVNPKVPISEWGWIGNPPIPLRPTPNTYNNSHTYTYYFTGDGSQQTFTYTDSTGNYIDNAGALNFEIYKLICPTSDTIYTCFGDSTGVASVYPNGGTPFDPDGISNSGDEYYNYSWVSANGFVWSTSQTAIGLPTGNFTVTISDSLGCSYQRDLYVAQAPLPLEIDTIYHVDVACKFDSTGSITAVVSGGFGSDFAVLILSGDTVFTQSGQLDTIQINNLPTGAYEFYVYDTIPDGLYGIYGCPQIVQVNIDEPQNALSSSINLLDNVTCWGDSTGKASANVIGGQFPYSYFWDNGETTAVADSLSAGWQAITYVDANNCTLRDSIEILHLNPEIIGSIQIIENVSCFGACDAIASVSSVGGVLPHTYFWDIGQVAINMPDTAFNLCYGGHDVVIEDALGCRSVSTFVISQPDELFAQASLTAHVTCYGFDNGLAFGSATGGTPTYSFVWDSINGQSGQNATNLTPGVHTLFVTDSEGCTASDTVVITEPDQLIVEIIDSMTIYSYCNGTSSGQLCAIASGGTPTYNYVWNDLLGQQTSCATDLLAGVYTVMVMDDRNCIASTTFDLDSVTNSMTPAGVSMSIDDVSCFGLYDGSITINNVAGGTPGFTYNWTGPNNYGSSFSDISSLYAGSYACVITDTNGCAITVNAEVYEPDQLEYNTYNVVDATCFGACDGQIMVDIEGGTAPYYYDVDELGVFPLANTLQMINDTLITDLCAGLHTIYITDANDCEGTVLWGGSWQEFIDSGVVVSINNVLTSDASCQNTNDGSAWIAFPGGNPLFTYTWETSPIGTVIDTGVSTSILYPGNYNLVAHYSDSSSFGQIYTGCDAVFPFTVNGPLPIVPGATVNAVLCYDDTTTGSIQLSPSGGTFPYTFAWDTTSSLPNGSTSPNINSLRPGTYTVTIVDAIGCEITEDFNVLEPTAITNNFVNLSDVSCFGLTDGSVTADANGGTGTYSYNWNPSGGNSSTANNLSAGNYSVTITDVNGCSDQFTISIGQPDAIIQSTEATSFFGEDLNGNPYNISCVGLSDGSAVVSNGGGVSPITYSWSPLGGSNAEASGLPAGAYTVTVEDANGCTEVGNVVLAEPTQIVSNPEQSGDLSLFGFDISCKGLSDGWAVVNPTGGVPGNNGIYQYSWSGPFTGNSNTNSIENLIAGNYSVTITDANGCEETNSFTLTEPAELFVANVVTTNYTGPQESPYIVNFIYSTVSPDPISHTWYWDGITASPSSNNSAGLTFNNEFTQIGLNSIFVIVQNESTGCVDSIYFDVEVQGIPNPIDNVFTPNGDNINDYFDFGAYGMETITVDIYNRWGELMYSWEGQNKTWNGKGVNGQDLPEGVYFYVLEAKGSDGEYYSKKGSITLIR